MQEKSPGPVGGWEEGMKHQHSISSLIGPASTKNPSKTRHRGTHTPFIPALGNKTGRCLAV